jgi:hypothetical protein
MECRQRDRPATGLRTSLATTGRLILRSLQRADCSAPSICPPCG